MANNNYTYQQTKTVSIPKKKLVDIASTYNFGKLEFRVLLVLFSELDGWDTYSKTKDPKNFRKIDVESIAHTLDTKEKKVGEAIKALEEAGIIERGKTDTIRKGYRFTF